eukprot:2211690-Heterocapsa_arctica.AAC.1
MEVPIPEKPVRVEVYGGEKGGEFLLLDSWPLAAETSDVLELFLQGGAGQSRLGSLTAAPSRPGGSS